MGHEMLWWILMLFWALTNGYIYWPRPDGSAPSNPIVMGGGWLLIFIIIGMLGWYGPMGKAIH